MSDAPTVIHAREMRDGDLYIGRGVFRGGYSLDRSRWANPFVVGKNGSRDHVIYLYEAYVRGTPALMAALPELRGKRLACWCRRVGDR